MNIDILLNQVIDIEHYGKSLFVKKNGSEKLLILLSTHNERNSFFGLKQVSENNQMNLLFVTDADNTYYQFGINHSEHNPYIHHIESHASKFCKENIYIFGSSMAGYAALKIGTEKNFNVITFNPQLSVDLSYDLSWPDLRVTFDKLKELQPINLENFNSKVYAFFGKHRMDVANYRAFIELFQGKAYFLHIIEELEHNFPYKENVRVLYDIIDFIEKVKL